MRRVLYTTHVSWWRRRRVPLVLQAQPPEPARPDETDAVDTAVAVRQALAALAPRQRAALILRYFDDRTETETARILGCSVGTVKSQVREALARLRETAPDLAVWAGRRGGTDA